MRISVLSILFLFYSAKGFPSILLLDPIVSEGVEEEVVVSYVKIMIKKMKNAGHDVMDVDDRMKFFERIGLVPYVIDERVLDIMRKEAIKWIIWGSIIKSGGGYFLTVEVWNTKEKEKIAYSEWFASEVELLNNIVKILKKLGIEGDFERYEAPKRILPSEKKSIPAAFFLSIIPGFGLGHFYCGANKAGRVFLIGEAGSLLVGFLGLSYANELNTAVAFTGISVLGFISFKSAEIISSIPFAIKYNKARKKGEGFFYPIFLKGGMGIGIGIGF